MSDELVITLRTGPSTQNAIVRNLDSGDAVEVLEADSQGGYSRVRDSATGAEGWVLTRYLTSEPVAREKLAAAERELATALSRIVELETQVNELTEQLGQTRSQLGETASANRDMAAELADIRSASANAIALREQNESLRRRGNELGQQLDLATMENAELASRNRQNWFVVGAAVLTGGIVIGLVAPSLRRRRKSAW